MKPADKLAAANAAFDETIEFFHKKGDQPMKRYGYTCPHCGNRDRDQMEENGADRRDGDFTLLCVARVEPEEDAFGGDANPPLDVGADGKVVCGMQWCPNEWMDMG